TTVRKLLKKSNCSAGFTLAETLVAVVILVLISAAALPAAMNAYRNAVDAANAQVLLSTTVNALRSELSTAWNVSADGTTITYQSADTGDKSVISLGEDCIMLQEYSRDDNPGWWGGAEKPTASPRPLVPDAMRQETRNSGARMSVTYGPDDVSISDDGMYITITGLRVERDGKILAKMPDETGLLIRVMSAESEQGDDELNGG
ncbi:MAG: prepilin-type N-terminal cleavage/methylation domain-containing protein, partial [Oscillospiraceae bacterium]|nr:prepilin-type N-terminal cleavage/methylation domain-containing protein [Oscillospiraceae bacterium]